MMLSAVAAISGIYDVLLGVGMLAGREALSRLFGTPLPVPPIHADLNGIFLIAIGLGYALPWRDPQRYRGYMWVMGPILKGAGAVVFILDVAVRQSPAGFLAFAASDGTLALVTLWALLASHPPRARASA
jgi:hypothetical protein